ncbi:MAG: zinc-dependent metalloprotease, partial [Gemmatimonadota bacterium]|nr:zinc-dependent metalloprotease [Gemmatimonadota bacterium]
AGTPDDEKSTLDGWILDRAGDPVFRFGDPSGTDPTSLTEAIGSDAMEASALGIENLKRILPNLYEWTHREGDDFAELQDLYNNLIGQWNRYMGHVLVNIGGVTRTRKAYGEDGPVYEIVPGDDQRRAVQFLADHAFASPTWMIDEEILGKLGNPRMVDRIRGLQVSVLNRALNPSRMQRLIEAEAQLGDDAYPLGELFDDVRGAVWSELGSGASVDVYRRNLQRAYVERMEYLMTQELNIPTAFFGFGGFTAVDVSQSDIRALARGELTTLRSAVQRGIGRAPDRMTRLHLEDILVRIDRVLDPNG